MFVKKIKAYDFFENDLRLVSAIEGAPPMNYGTPYIWTHPDVGEEKKSEIFQIFVKFEGLVLEV